MKLKDLLIVLVIIQLAIFLYYLPNTVRSFVNIFDVGLHEPLFIFQYLNRIISVVMNVIGIIGVVLYFSQKNNIYNKALKIFLIHHTISLIAFLPTRMMWIFDPPTEDFSFPWHYHLMFAFSIFLIVVAISLYSTQRIRVLPAPIGSRSVRFAHYIVDNLYLNSLILSSISFFSGNYGWSDSSFDYYQFVNIAFAFLMPFIYYTVCEAGFRQSIGKVLTGAFVCSEKGSVPGFARILGRSLCRYIPFEPFSFLPDPMAKWHDKFSGTDVFYKSNVNFEEDSVIDHLVIRE